jgi:hypothetical protein
MENRGRRHSPHRRSEFTRSFPSHEQFPHSNSWVVPGHRRLEKNVLTPQRIRPALWLVSLVLVAAPSLSAGAQLTLTWTDKATNETGYRVERKTGSTGTYSQIAVLGANSISYVDPSLAGSTTYCYRVRAYNAAGVSAYSNEACKTTASTSLTLTVKRSGTGNGYVYSSPTGITCGSDCTQGYPSGTVVTLTAVASAGSRFAGWSGGGCSGTGKCTISGNVSTTITATFTVLSTARRAPAEFRQSIGHTTLARAVSSTISTWPSREASMGSAWRWPGTDRPGSPLGRARTGGDLMMDDGAAALFEGLAQESVLGSGPAPLRMGHRAVDRFLAVAIQRRADHVLRGASSG